MVSSPWISSWEQAGTSWGMHMLCSVLQETLCKQSLLVKQSRNTQCLLTSYRLLGNVLDFSPTPKLLGII